jgi:hypothetical protein
VTEHLPVELTSIRRALTSYCAARKLLRDSMI